MRVLLCVFYLKKKSVLSNQTFCFCVFKQLSQLGWTEFSRKYKSLDKQIHQLTIYLRFKSGTGKCFKRILCCTKWPYHSDIIRTFNYKLMLNGLPSNKKINNKYDKKCYLCNRAVDADTEHIFVQCRITKCHQTKRYKKLPIMSSIISFILSVYNIKI